MLVVRSKGGVACATGKPGPERDRRDEPGDSDCLRSGGLVQPADHHRLFLFHAHRIAQGEAKLVFLDFEDIVGLG